MREFLTQGVVGNGAIATCEYIFDLLIGKSLTVNTAKTEAIPSRPELAAAIAAAIAEYTGKDISGIRIHSIKKL